MGNIVMLLMIMVVFYFFMIRPQIKRQKELKKFHEGLSVGDKVVTIGGMHGKVLEVSESTILMSIESGKVRVDKTSISNSPEDKIRK
ncbi:MAG: preprotein translocase subunit YajC [Bacteroidetes bacterium RIFCSPHIGHO2_02_FULL_44_7]|nr:MAG: preprotein translocase subunit YajC [Bacteroidetes bacterium RIFCSPHIGHO2_02_FULL_44_7]